MSVTTDVLVDAENIFCKIVLKKKKFKIRNEAQKTHALFWQKDLVEVTKSSTVSIQETIPQTKQQNMQNIIYL